MDKLQIVKRTASGLNVLGEYDLSRNPNLLHNWDFTNPVNQRGATTYLSTSGEIPTIDRWRAGTNMKVELVSGGIKLTGQGGQYRNFRQTIENPERLAGKQVTVSLNILACTGKFSSYFQYGSSGTGGGIINAGETGIKKFAVTLPSASDIAGSLKFHIGNSNDADVSLTLASVKLEIGDVSTLKDTDVADYAEQEMICQRYLVPIAAAQRFRLESYTSDVLQFHIPTPQRMRALPTVEDVSALSIKTLAVVGSGVSISGIETLRRDPDVFLRVNAPSHGLTDCLLYADRATFLNAEL